MKVHRLACLPIAVGICMSFVSHAGEGPVSLEWNARLRHENVSDAGYARDANATTLRLRAGLRGDLGNGFSALVEGEGVTSIEDRYNSGANGRTAYPVVADPASLELNQAWIAWKRDGNGATLGRQRVQYDNHRWVGNVGWRQNEQTFDAVSAQWALRPTLTARYAWLDRVHRVSSDEAIDPLARERRLDSHLVNVAHKTGLHQVTAYAYLHDDEDVAAASSATLGARWSVNTVKDGHGWGLVLEAARQRDHADNPLDFSHSYWLVEPSLARRGITLHAGWEHLGGDGAHALQTPLATLHAFNGWADRFLVTPAGGLEDRYVGAGGKLGGGRFDWKVVLHDYRADTGGRYGTEWDASLGFPVYGPVRGLVKVADYRSDGYAGDTRKLFVQFEWAN